MSENKYKNMSSQEKMRLIHGLSGRLFDMTGDPYLHNLRENARYAYNYLEQEDSNQR